MSGDVDKNSHQASLGATSGKGLRDFFRRKSSGGGSARGLDTAGVGDADGSSVNTSVESQDSNTLSVGPDPLSGSAYGNYLTVSGTGASILKDLFHKKYRAAGNQTVPTEERETKKKISFGQATFFGFRTKKDKGHDGYDSETESKSAKSGVKDGRSRHKSGPDRAFNAVGGSDVESKSKSGKMRTFLDSFRMHSKPEPLSSGGSHADPTLLARQLRSYEPETTHRSVTGKQKKFRVTPTKKEAEIGPNEFVELYRNRAFSDSRPEDLMAARAAARRQKFAGERSPYRGEVNGFERRSDKKHFVVWRDKRKGTKIFQLPSTASENAIRDEFGDPDDSDLAYVRFMKSHSCYDLIPSSSKLVIFDTQLTVKKAFVALVQNGVRAAVLWDTQIQDFAGMLTVSDFIQILQKYYHSSLEQLNEVETNRICTWKELLDCRRRMVCIEPESSLFDAVRSLQDNRVHRLLVLDGFRGNPLNLLSHKRILKFLHQNLRHLQRPSFMDKTLEELQVGTFENLATLLMDAPLIQALNLFVERKVSAIPIIDSEGRAVDLFAKIDTATLIHEKLYSNLDVSVMEVLKDRRENFPGVLTCRKTETLEKVVDRIVGSSVHRLIVVDEKEHVVGVVSLSDILHYLILHPAELRKKSSSCDQIETAATSVSDSLLDSCHDSDRRSAFNVPEVSIEVVEDDGSVVTSDTQEGILSPPADSFAPTSTVSDALDSTAITSASSESSTVESSGSCATAVELSESCATVVESVESTAGVAESSVLVPASSESCVVAGES